VRYAITKLGSYLIVLLGIFIAFRYVGLRWNQIQWMATALTLGLAFGLQEMFANFVSGIIILFERPIRVGDIVTVDDVTGVVARVRMRATTITNWDRKDYIVPNKDFITGRVLNWTLSDQVNRIVITIGIAYGSDVEKARSILGRIAYEHPLTVNDPPADVTFEEFSDSSLKLVVRCFIAMKDMPFRLRVINQLHTEINAAFRAAGVEIAFPQHDLHIRSMPNSQPFAATM
jgi:potassium efflux system protein